MKRFYILLIILSFISLLFEISSDKKVESVPVTNTDDTHQYAKNVNISLEDSIFQSIISNDIEHPDIVYAQAILETGYFTSKIFVENNNLFGMKMPKRRETFAINEKNNHAAFESWYDSIQDYKIWQSTYASNKSRDEYFDYLEKHYSEDKQYVKKLKRILDDKISKFIAQK